MMTKKEALDKIEELKKYIESLDKKTGYSDDEIFLLSTEEYEKYKDNIPLWKSWWWLRSPGNDSNLAASVSNDGSVIFSGISVYYVLSCVRPALNLKSSNHKIGERIIKYNFPWIYIGDGLCIAEVPIATSKFDDESNDYETSHIRKFLNDWKEERK